MNIGDSEITHQIKPNKECYCEQLAHTMIGFICSGEKRIYEKEHCTVVSEGQVFMLRSGVYFIEDIPTTSTFKQTIFRISAKDIYRNMERLAIDNQISIPEFMHRDLATKSIYITTPNVYLNLIFSKMECINNHTGHNDILDNILRHHIDMLIATIVLDIHSSLRKPLLSGIDIDKNIFQSILFSSILKPDCTLDELARKTHNSRTAFKQKFAKIYSTTPHKWIVEHRLNISIPLLLATNNQVSEIAIKCGFIDTSHYIRLFKLHFKTTPRAYRSSKRKQIAKL